MRAGAPVPGERVRERDGVQRGVERPVGGPDGVDGGVRAAGVQHDVLQLLDRRGRGGGRGGGDVTATDDSGEPVTYAITAGNEDGRFAIDEDTGAITVAGDLSGGAGTTATLTVAARDAAGGEATVTVTVRVSATCDSGTAAPNPASNPGLVADCKTLLGLKGALAGAGTLDWSGDAAMSDWSGISIGDAPQRVIGVKLRNNGLGGILPGALGDLTGLQDLWLSGNQLTWKIPQELGNLTSLYSLYLDQNQLAGEIPAALGALSDLEDLFLYNNQLTGSIPPEVAGLEELRQLWITNNQLTGMCSNRNGHQNRHSGIRKTRRD